MKTNLSVIAALLCFNLDASALDCLQDGVRVPDSASRIFYRKSYIPMSWGGDCAAYSRVRKCVGGVLSGGEIYAPTGETFSLAACKSAKDLVQPTISSNLSDRQRDWKLVFHDEFLSESNAWAFENGPMWLGGYRVPERAVVADGRLTIENRKGTRAPSPLAPLYNSRLKETIYPSQMESAHLITNQKFKYGAFEIRAKMSGGPAIDTAFWLTSGGPEIDIFETFYMATEKFRLTGGLHPRVWDPVTKKWVADPASKNFPELRSEKVIERNLAAEFHTYTLIWDPTKIVWLMDGVEIRREGRSVVTGNFNIPMQLRISTAMTNVLAALGVTAPIDAKSTSSEFVIDYVRVFQD